VDITEEEFNKRMADYQETLTKQFEESHKLEAEILTQLKQLQFKK
jgi:type I restriction enzyme M protein